LDGRVPNEFASAAFRIGHTLLQEKLHRTNEHHQLNDGLFLSEVGLQSMSVFSVQLITICAVVKSKFAVDKCNVCTKKRRNSYHNDAPVIVQL